jgi:prepilin-type N-terminal cleavage/methylation domain-containing protein
MRARSPDVADSEQGFTLVELVVTMSIVSIIVASLAGAFVVAFKSMGSTQQRFDQAHDPQLLAMYFMADAQSVDPGGVTILPTAPLPCSTPSGQSAPGGTDVLQLKWTGWDVSGPHADVVQYHVEPQSDGTFQLSRYFCVDDSPFTRVVVTHNLPSGSVSAAPASNYPAEPAARSTCTGDPSVSVVACQFGAQGETLALHITPVQLPGVTSPTDPHWYSFEVRGTRRHTSSP